MPLTKKGHKIMAAMKEQYGEEEGERVFYASANSGKITGVHKAKDALLADEEPDGHVWTRGATLADNDTILDAVCKHRDGYLTCEARVARTGVQRYRGYEVGMPEKDHVILYRPPEEVFARDAMRSLANKPITLTHPKQMVDSKTWSKVAKGFSGNEVLRDGEFVRVPLMLTDAAAISAFESGKARELSVGYTTDIDWTPGQAPDGTAYHGVQRGIRGNHHALVPVARGGDHLKFGDADLGDDDVESYDREFSAEQRKTGAEEGWAKPDGSYPIRNTGDLKNAIRAWGRGGATASDKAWIKKRAKALGAESMLPEDWKSSASDAAPSDGASSDEETIVMPYVKTFDGIPIQFADEISAVTMEREVRKLQDQVENFKGKKAKPFGKGGNGNGNGSDDDDEPVGDQDAAAIEAARRKVTAEDAVKKAVAAKDGEIAILKKQLADAQTADAKAEALAEERIATLDAAKPFLPQDFKPAGKNLADIRRAAVATQLGDAEIKDWDDAQVIGAFRTMAKLGATKSGGGAKALADGLTRGFAGNPEYRGSTSALNDAEREAEKAWNENRERLQNAYKQPFTVVRN